MKKNLCFLLTIFLFANAHAQVPQANGLWKKVSALSGVDQQLNFHQDTTLSPGAYSIVGNRITWNGTQDEPGAVYAVARLAVELFAATMPHPDTIRLKKSEWRNLTISFIPTLSPNSIDNRVPKKVREWCHWHHMPTVDRTEDDHLSGFLGMAQEYGHLYPGLSPTGPLRPTTKVDILHPAFPKVLFDRWDKNGRPAIVNMFEIDGSGTWWLEKYFPPPIWMNNFEKDFFTSTLNAGEKKTRSIGTNGRASDGKRYVFSQKAIDAIDALPYNWDDDSRFKLNTTDLYAIMYKNVENYFLSQGVDNVRFKVYAYANYRLPPSNPWINLARFDVYYVSPNTPIWTEADMEKDAFVSMGWKATGARFISRANTLLKGPPANPILFAEYLYRVKPDGFAQSTAYSEDKHPSMYLQFRALQGIDPKQAYKEFYSN